MQTIEPAIQNHILEILPDDGQLAISLMCQLLANMVLSIDDANIDDAVKLIRLNLAEYEGT